MKIKKFKRTLPVLYRWSRRRRYFPHAVAVLCAIVFLPLGFVSSAKISGMISANNALAATRAAMPEQPVFEILPEEQRPLRGTLIGLVLEDPDKLDTLIGNDLMEMFDAPELQRKEGSMSVWQYRTSECVLDVFMADSTQVVDHYEIRQRKVAVFATEAPQESDVDHSACLKGIYEQRQI